jgi:hypothetical protein
VRSVLRRYAPLLVTLAACHEPAPLEPRHLVIEEPLTLCAAMTDSNDLPWIAATQWQLEIPAGDVELPSKTVPTATDARFGIDVPIELDLALRDIDGEDSTVHDDERAVIIEDAMGDDALDMLSVRVGVVPFAGTMTPRALWLTIEAPNEDDFVLTPASWMDGFASFSNAFPGLTDSFAPSGGFTTCDPGGATPRLRIALDRGFVVLDFRTQPLAFVGAELDVDDIEVAQQDYFHLLASTSRIDGTEGEFAVLVPTELGDLGCGVVLTLDAGKQHAALVDCDLVELAPLEIRGITQEQ